MSLNPKLYPPLPPVVDEAPRPFWTVLVPAYKPDFLPQALTSVIAQDPGAEEMEILVLDDCSPHALEPIVRLVCGERASYIRQKENLGTYANENDGLARSRGLWIHILNDDDWILPGFYAAFRQVLEDAPPKVGAACCQQLNVDHLGRTLSGQTIRRDTAGIVPDMLMQLAACNPTHPVGTVIRRSTFERLGRFYTKLNTCADWDFNRRAAVFYDWWFEPRPLACYRQHAGSATHAGRASGEQLRDLRECIEISGAYLPPDTAPQLMAHSLRACAETALRLADNSLWNGDLPLASEQIDAALQMCRAPEILKQLAGMLAQPVAVRLGTLRPDFFAPTADTSPPSTSSSSSR